MDIHDVNICQHDISLQDGAVEFIARAIHQPLLPRQAGAMFILTPQRSILVGSFKSGLTG